MRWSSPMLSKLGRVRDLRLRMAEMTLARIEHELAGCRQAEEQARQELTGAAERCVAETAQANDALLGRTAGGRLGISDWHAARQRAQFGVRMARGKVDDAASERLGKELECSSARSRWRDARLETERMRLLAQQLAEMK